MLVGVVVLLFLQDWRAMILPIIDVPVSIIGTFAVMALAGLQPEQHLAVRPGPGHRHRRGRRHRGAGKHRAHDGARPRSAHRHPQGDGRGHRPDHRGGSGALRRVRALRLPQRHHRPVLLPVRRDHRGLDDDLGPQRRHHDAVPGRADLHQPGAPAPGETGTTPWRHRTPEGSPALVDFRCHRRPWCGFGLAPASELCDSFLPLILCPLSSASLAAWPAGLSSGPINAGFRWFFRGFNFVFDGITGGYGWTIRQGLHHSPFVLLAYCVLVVLTFVIFARRPRVSFRSRTWAALS